MTIICKCAACGYCQNGFCASKTTAINEQGMCSYVYKISRGQVVRRPQFGEVIEDEFKADVAIIDGAVRPVEGENGPDEGGE